MILKVANLLVDLYEDCCNGNYEMLEELRATCSQTSASVVKVGFFLLLPILSCPFHSEFELMSSLLWFGF